MAAARTARAQYSWAFLWALVGFGLGVVFNKSTGSFHRLHHATELQSSSSSSSSSRLLKQHVDEFLTEEEAEEEDEAEVDPVRLVLTSTLLYVLHHVRLSLTFVLLKGLYFSIAVCVVLVLILLTILFELTKEHLEEKATQNMKPILENLFGEMTVLGFLSVVTFCFTKTGVFEQLGQRVFGEAHAKEMLELFEAAHFILFFVMIFFVIQVLLLLQEAQENEVAWLEMDQEVRNPGISWRDRTASYYQDHHDDNNKRFRVKQYLKLLPMIRNLQKEKDDDLLLFKALRDEFILDRELDYPFRPAQEQVSQDFNFGRYLSMCMGLLLSHVVQLRVRTWIYCAALTICYYLFSMLVHENGVVLAWTWVAIAWIVFFVNIHLERHLQMLLYAFASKELSFISGVEQEHFQADESSGLLESSGGGNGEEASTLLPDWCNVDIDDYLQSRPLWNRFLVGGVPNRQQALYWMDRKGLTFYLSILQMNILFLGIYGAVMFVRYVRVQYDTQSVGVFCAYVVLAFLPAHFIALNKKHLVAVLTPVCCLGHYRRPQVIARVIRQEKTGQAVRSFIILYKLRRFASKAASTTTTTVEKSSSGLQNVHYSTRFDPFEIDQINFVFDEFDLDGSGSITIEEFKKLMSLVGATLTDHELHNLVEKLDTDQSGGVSKDEFLQWYADHSTDDDFTAHDLGKFMFQIFDTDNNGEITSGEFKKRLESRSSRFTADEITDLVNELDEKNSGSICAEEFEHLIHKYYPRELTRSHGNSSH